MKSSILSTERGLKNILVIGSSGSIGSSLCISLEKLGYNCIRSTRRESDSPLFLDLNDITSIDKLADNLPDLAGLIILGGKEPSENIESISENHLDEMINIHFKGVLWIIKKLKNKIMDGGTIITTSSVSSHKGSYDPSYSSMKSAIEGLTRTLVRDLSPHIRINSVAPGLIEGSKVFNGMSHDFRENHLNTTPLKRFATMDDIVETYIFLLRNKHITGQTIHVNGGQYIG